VVPVTEMGAATPSGGGSTAAPGAALGSSGDFSMGGSSAPNLEAAPTCTAPNAPTCNVSGSGNASSGNANGAGGSGNGAAPAGSEGSSNTLPGDVGTGGAAGTKGQDSSAKLPPPPANIATLLWAVGGQGVGPGLFEDARFVGVDSNGTIYVAEFPEDNAASRVQRFGPDGSFLGQWFVADDRIVNGLVADRNGIVYILQGGDITRYDGATGMPLGLVELPIYADSPLAIALAPDNGLLSVARTQILRLSSALQVTLDVDTIGPALDNSIFIHGAAMDGTGNIFVVVDTKSSVYKFDSAGTFRDSIGASGTGVGRFDTFPESVASDGRGRIYAPDFDGIEVFEADGTSRGSIPVPGVFGTVVSEKNELIAIARNDYTLLKYALSP